MEQEASQLQEMLTASLHGTSFRGLRTVGVACHYLVRDSIRPGFPPGQFRFYGF